MTHPRTRTGRSLIGLVLVLMGLSAYGCGDTGTGTQPAELGDISASAGKLEPKFNTTTTTYTVKLFGNEASTTITVRPQVAGDSVRINNQERTSQTVTLASVGTFEDLTILVTDTGAGGTSKSYTIRVSREAEDTTLQALSSSDGTVAPSPFDKSKSEQSINDIGNNVTSITLTATKSDPNTVMVIKSPSGEVTVSAGTALGKAIVPLGAPGSAITVPIVITGPKGGESTYKVTINRGASDNNFLKTFSISPGIDIKNVTQLTYNVNVESNVGQVTVSATLQDSTASMTVNGKPTKPGEKQTITLKDPGVAPSRTDIDIIVTAENQAKNPYKITVIRAALNGNNNLKSLSIAPGRLDFKVNQPKYDVNVLSGVGTVTVTATPEDPTAKITILRSGATITSQPITLLGPGDTTPITVRVTADNGRSQDYTINVKRAALNGNADLKSLAESSGSLRFTDPDILDYTVNLLSDVTSVRITAAPEDSAATVAINNGQPQPISLGAPGPEVRITVPVVVTAQNQQDKNTYNILFIRAALGGNNNLGDLTVTGHTLSPTFSQTRTNPNYELEVDNNVDSVTVSATPQDASARVGLFVSDAPRTNPISLPPGPSTTEIEIRVTAPNATEKSYFITVTRTAPSSNANLSALSVTAGTAVTPLSSPFDSNTVTVAPKVGEVVVRATKDDANATMAIGGNTVSPGTNSGQATFPLNGSGGEPTTISFTVTAQDGGTVKTYTIFVIRPAAPTPPAKPATAPDLIPEDDSCLTIPSTGACDLNSGSTRTDDITTVKQPRFKIATPTDEETPHLYIDGQEDTGAEYNKTDKTLKPSKELSDAKYKITNTVSRGDAESPQSDPLEVTIDSAGLVNPGKK